MITEFKLSGELLSTLRDENKSHRYVLDCIVSLVNATTPDVASVYVDEEGNESVKVSTVDKVAYFELFFHKSLKTLVWQEIVFDSQNNLLYSNSYSSNSLHYIVSQCEQIARL